MLSVDGKFVWMYDLGRIAALLAQSLAHWAWIILKLFCFLGPRPATGDI